MRLQISLDTTATAQHGVYILDENGFQLVRGISPQQARRVSQGLSPDIEITYDEDISPPVMPFDL